jgi:glyoxylase-like metal-dependent hydrolase (beta-lactamase superfamily II)
METFRFQLGTFDCMAINDGYINTIPARDFFAGAKPVDLHAAFMQHGIQQVNLRIPVIILYVDTGTHKVLIDTGGGPTGQPETGHLYDALLAEGIQPGTIDRVLLSHGHWDHVAGNLRANGSLAFPHARYVMNRDEYNYWTQVEDPEEIPLVYQNLITIQGQLDLIGPDDEIVPGVRALAAPGHTRYHTTFLVTSGDEQLYCLIDTVDHPLHFEQVRWRPAWDMLPEKSTETRQRIFGEAAQKRALVHGFHLPFPGLGHLQAQDKGWRYQPLEA